MNSRQEFHNQVGQVLQAETVTQIHNDQGRQITSKERYELNQKVKALENDYGESGREIWLYIHRALGIESIDEMCIGHLPSAHAILNLMLESADLQKHIEESPLGKAEAELEACRVRAERAEAKAIELLRRCTKAEAEARDVGKNRKSGGLLFLVIALLATSAWLGFHSYQAAGTASRANERMNVCVLDGSPYQLGSVIDDKLDLECVRQSNGVAAWRRISAKSKRPQH